MLTRSRTAFALLLMVAVALSACAAKTVRDKARVGGLVASQAAIAVSQTESNLYATIHYDAATHATLVDGKLQLLYLAQAYDSAVLAWPAGTPTPAAVESARADLLAAIDSFAHLLPAAESIRGPLNAALIGLREALASQTAARALPPVQSSEMPPGGILAILALAQMIAQLVASGRSTVERILETLKQEGATDEELRAARAALSAEIARVEAERDEDETQGQ